MTRTIAIIQARMGSTRLPGKVLMKLAGRSVLAHVVQRTASAKSLTQAVVATTTGPADNAIVDECARLDTPVFRGSEEDVLDRYFRAAEKFGAERIVRITSDCPLYDGGLLDRMLTAFDADYMSNVLKRTFPRGLDTEIFTFSNLKRAHREAKQSPEREHVTPYFYQHPELFRLQSYEEAPDLSGHRWTLDTPEDWEFLQRVYTALYRPGGIFTTAEVLNLLRERPELTKINAHIEQKKL
jgi:spore coat polysaccharide biosynthesis protein SpsF